VKFALDIFDPAGVEQFAEVCLRPLARGLAEHSAGLEVAVLPVHGGDRGTRHGAARQEPAPRARVPAGEPHQPARRD
jgi:hypothetical protein